MPGESLKCLIQGCIRNISKKQRRIDGCLPVYIYYKQTGNDVGTCENDKGTCGNYVRTFGNDVGMPGTSGNAWGRYVDTRGNYSERERLGAMWERVGTM